ncbi:MAG: hypothetical protein FGM40_08700 [Rhodocyclaceae bacterium]|nr:hypothetical protein [Rhodocyclaceae bacterium]
MNIYIYAFLLFGACFGAATFSCRYLFSEGPKKIPDPPGGPTLASRVFWVMVCTFLWPIMVLTGVNSALILARRRRHSAA